MKSSLKLMDSDNRVIAFKDMIFSDQAQHIQILDDLKEFKTPLKIVLRGGSSSADVGKLFILKTALDSLEKNLEIDVYIPYLPYAREDRNCLRGQSFALSYFARCFNLFFPHSKLFILDIHNKDSLELFNNAFSFNQIDAICDEMSIANLLSFESCGIICPDKGAVARVEGIAGHFKKEPFHEYLIYCDKKRDLKTGKIISFSASTVGKYFTDLILFDDICNGGGTFLASAKEIRKQLPEVNLYLCVSHGIFSKGMKELKVEFEKIYCLNPLSLDSGVILSSWEKDFLK